MENTKTLLLVDPKLYRPSMRDKTSSKLDEKIDQTLNADYSDKEMAFRYLAALKNYRHYDAEDNIRADTKVKKSNIETEVLQLVLPPQQYRAKRIIDHMSRNRDVQVGDNEELIYKQQKLHGSHITDLISDVLKKTGQNDSPVG